MGARNVDLPPGAVTGVGSLPHGDADEAVRFVAEAAPAVPWWPQLPRRSPDEGMLRQFLGPAAALLESRRGGAGWRIKDGAAGAFRRHLAEGDAGLSEGSAAGFHAFLRAAAGGAFPGACAVKGQITGPVTLGALLFEDDRRLGEDPDWRELLAAFVARGAAWQVARLAETGRPVILVADEPGLHSIVETTDPAVLDAALASLRTVVRATRRAGALAGIHACARPRFDLLAAAGPDLISFDAFRDQDAFAADASARAFLARGGRVAFGLVPPCSVSVAPGEDDLLARWRAAAGPRGPVALARATLVTSTCGLALETQDSARAAFALAHRLGARVAAAAAGT